MSIVSAAASLRSRATAQITTLPIFWQDEQNSLPPEPSPFVFFELIADPAQIVSYGGGRGNNRYRCPAELNGYVFTPRDIGLPAMLPYAEHVAAAFRSFRDSVVSCGAATVHPLGEGQTIRPRGSSVIPGGYAALVVVIGLHFDQIG